MTMETGAELLILGKGEIARALADLAVSVGYPVQVAEPGAAAEAWPPGVKLLEQVYSESPYQLPPHTHAVIARGHEGDAESVAALLNHGAERVYLIASARRSLSVIEAATPLLREPATLSRLSAPAGLDLGGRGSGEIALAILAEVQRRRYDRSGKPLTELREERAQRPATVTSDEACPGKRE
jgi:xanthine dehydrogenase accessory factor